MSLEEFKELMMQDDEIIECEPEEDEEKEYIPLKDHKYVIVSKIAYLIGVNSDKFGDESKIYKKDVYKQLDINKNARIIRNLCRIRTALEQKYQAICNMFKTSGRDVLTMGEFIPQDAVIALTNDGVRLSQKAGTYPVNYIIEINGLISDRINNCKALLPTWLNWEYVKEMFIMPDGLNQQGAADAAAVFYEHKNCYPFHIYINWPPEENGNILLNDNKFVNLLYEQHGDVFKDRSKVMDVSEYVKTNIYDFIDQGKKIAMIVDCENSDVYNIISMLRSLKWENHLDKISKIILINDPHQNIGWQQLESYTDIPVEHIMAERIKTEKSLVDGTVIAKTYEEFYENSVDSFVLLSSDSDFWALIRMLKKARFLVMVQHSKCGPDLKEALEEECIFYCYLDDFYSGEESDAMKNDMLLKSVAEDLQARDFNIKDVFNESLLNLRIDMNDAERKQFFIKHFKNIQLAISDDGKVTLRLKTK